MKLEKIKSRYYYPRWYTPRNFIRNIKIFIRGFKYKIQRNKYGVSSVDCWNFDTYLNKVLYNGLQIYKKDANCYPGNMTAEEWDDILAEMIYLSGELLKEDSEESNELYDIYCKSNKEEDGEAWFKSITEFESHKKLYRKRLFDLLYEYGENLWW